MILVIQLRIISNFSAGCREGYSRDSFIGMSFYDRRYETKIKYGARVNLLVRKILRPSSENSICEETLIYEW